MADSHEIPWQEYWPFLDAFVDLRSLEGLKKLESHMSKQNIIINYEAFKLQRTPLRSAPLQISKAFIQEPEEEKQENEDDSSDSFVSALDFGGDDKQGTVPPVNGNGVESSTVFHDCKEESGSKNGKCLEGDHVTNRSESSFQKLWNSLGHLKELFSPKSKSEQKKNTSESHPPPSSFQEHSIEENSHASKQISSDKKSSKEVILDSNSNPNQDSAILNRDQNITNITKQSSYSSLEDEKTNSCSKLLFTDDKELKQSACQDSYLSQSEYQSGALMTSTPIREWSYRNSAPIIHSPEDQFSYVISDSGKQNEMDDLNEGKNQLSKNESATTPMSEQQNEAETSAGLISPKDDSFDHKMNSLCRGLEKFQFQSPPSSSPAETCIVDPNFSHSPRVNPFGLQIFSEIDPCRFIEDLESKMLKGHNDAMSTIKPVLILRQVTKSTNCSEGEDCILADIYLPQSKDRMLADAVMEESAQKDIHGHVWLNFLVAFPTKHDAQVFTSLHNSEIVDVTVVGLPSEKSHFLER